MELWFHRIAGTSLFTIWIHISWRYQVSILNLFSIVLRVCNLTDFPKSHVSSVRLDFTYRTPSRLIKANKSPCYVLRYVNKHSFLLPQVYGISLFPKTRPTQKIPVINVNKSWTEMKVKYTQVMHNRKYSCGNRKQNVLKAIRVISYSILNHF